MVAPTAALELVRPDAGWRVFAGVLAAAGFLAVLVCTVVLRLGHEQFLRVHRLFGLVFGVGALHALRVPAVTGLPWVVRGYLLAITVAGVGAWLYRSGHGRTLVRRHYYRVAEVRRLGADVAQLALTPARGTAVLDFEPGQLVFIGLDDEAVGRELHPFSLTSAPGERDLRLAIKSVGDFTGGLPAVGEGAWAMVEGPYGSFWHDGRRHRRQVWIAGGIGITPFLSMARSLDDDEHEIDLYYCIQDAEAGLFLDELYAIADRHPRLRVVPIPADALGFLSAADVAAASGDLGQAHIYLCGPPAMTDALVPQFVALGVPRDHLHYEEFRLRGRPLLAHR